MKSLLALSLQKQKRIQTFFFALILLGIVLLLSLVHNLFIMFLLSLVTFFLLSPAVNFFERRGLSRLNATLIPFLGMTAFFAILVVYFSPSLFDQATSLQEKIPAYLKTFQDFTGQWQTKLASDFKFLPKDLFQVPLQDYLLNWLGSAMAGLPEILSQSLTILFLVPLFAFFMLLEGRVLVRLILQFAPNHLFELFLNLNYQISSQIGGFIRARLIETVIISLVTWVGLGVLGFPYALLLAVLAGILNVIPYIGPVIGALPAFALALSNPELGAPYFWLFVIYGMGQLIDTVILVPFLVAKIVNLHPVTVIVSILVGAQFMGILGMIICIPLMSTLKVSFNSIYGHLTEFRNNA